MSKDYGQLWKDVTDTADEGKAVRTLAEILVDKEGRNSMSKLECKDAELCIQILDRGIAEHKLKAAEKRAFLLMLRRLAGCHGRLPDSMMITERIEVEDKILASGGFADIRCGRHMGHLVAVKTVRVSEQDDSLKIRKQFCKEVVLWNALSHPNVLKLAGVQGGMEKGQFVTVSEWMVHGNIMEFIKKNSVNRLELLHGAAQGLRYLHGASFTHGDLKGANILMSNDTPPRACLADFDFMTPVRDPAQPMSCSAKLEGGTITFMSPELLAPKKFGVENSKSTNQADIYAFGLVIFQVLTGEIPFRGVQTGDLVLDVVRGVRPTKPENASAIGFSDSLWGFVQRCWDGDMNLRPEVGEVVKQLERAAADWDGVMPPSIGAEGVASASKESTLDSMKYRGIFQSLSDIAPESPIESQTASELFDPLSTPSTQCTEPPSEELQEVVTKPSNESYPYLDQNLKSPPSQLPQEERAGPGYPVWRPNEIIRHSSRSQHSQHNHAYLPDDKAVSDTLDMDLEQSPA